MAQNDNENAVKDSVDAGTKGAPGTTGAGSEGSAAGGVSGGGLNDDVDDNIVPGMRGVDTRTTGGIGFVTKDCIDTETSVVPVTEDNEDDKNDSARDS